MRYIPRFRARILRLLLILTIFPFGKMSASDTLIYRSEYIHIDEVRFRSVRFHFPVSRPVKHQIRRQWAISTNLLLDALAMPTLGVEMGVGRNISIHGEWTYAWWSHRSHNFFWRIYGGDIGIRWWFGTQARKRRLSGHHLGLFLQALIWDFETGGRGFMGGAPPGDAIWNRANLGAGVEYGYSLPLSNRWNMDFCIGIGYLGGAYREYIPMCGQYVWQSTKPLHYFGPTKAEVSLVYQF